MKWYLCEESQCDDETCLVLIGNNMQTCNHYLGRGMSSKMADGVIRVSG